jgi:hypothetical protein
MISRLQKSALVEQVLRETLQAGIYPDRNAILLEAERRLGHRHFGAPLTQFRAAVPGLPIGGRDGQDLARNFHELLADLNLLYTALFQLSTRAIDLYDLFSMRRDSLSLKMAQLKVEAGTMLAQVHAASRDSVGDSFNTLEHTDQDRTNAFVDLDEGAVNLKPDSERSVSYDGSRIHVTRTIRPAGASDLGQPFSAVFSPYRTDAWYAQLPIGSVYEAQISVTGADYDAGDTAEVEINALRIQPTGPLRLTVQWSPDGRNWHDLEPVLDTVVTDQRTFHFEAITVGYLRFRVAPSGNTTGGAPVVGIKRLELLARGYGLSTSFYSSEWKFDDPVHTVVATLDAEVPFGTKIDSFLAQNADGPWVQIGQGPVHFGNVLDQKVDLTAFAAESDTGRIYYAAIPDKYVLPESGELWAGSDQVELSAFPYDWGISMDRDHLPAREDWDSPKGMVRSAVFSPRGDLTLNEAAADGFVSDRNPLAIQSGDDASYGVLCITEPDGTFVLQPGYNYRLRAYVFCTTPQTLEGQKIGVINPEDSGGLRTAVVAPHSLFLNGNKVYERKNCAVSVDLLNDTYAATLPLVQGWNMVELLVQLPTDLETRRVTSDSGVSSGQILLLFQPDLFTRADANWEEVRAYQTPWKKVSEFDLRYNVAPTVKEVWSWRLDPTDASVSGVLFNHNPGNPVSGSADYVEQTGYYTIDGLAAGRIAKLELRYTVERTDVVGTEPRSLWFRAELSKEEGVSQVPRLLQYGLLIN